MVDCCPNFWDSHSTMKKHGDCYGELLPKLLGFPQYNEEEEETVQLENVVRIMGGMRFTEWAMPRPPQLR